MHPSILPVILIAFFALVSWDVFTDDAATVPERP